MTLLKISFEDSLKIPLKASAAFGVMLKDRRKTNSTLKKILYHIYNVLCFLSLSLAIFGAIVYMFIFSVSFLSVTIVLPCICLCMISVWKFGTMAAKVEKSKKLLNDLEDLWPAEEDLDQQSTDIIMTTLTRGRKANSFFAIAMIALAFVFDISSLLLLILQYFQTGEVVKDLPYLIYMPWDTKGTYSYPLAYIYDICSSSVAFAGLVASDSFFIASIFHICTQLKLLHTRISNLVDDVLPSNLSQSLEINHGYHQKMYEELIECVKRHSELIAISRALEDIFSLSILFNFTNSSIIICCVGFNAMALTGIDLAIFIVFLVVALSQIALLSWAGNHLMDTSQSIGDAAYNSTWYLADKKFRKLIHIIIMRAQRPLVITAFGFSVVSFQSFSSILSTSYSYFALLQTAYKNN